ncbi:MAG: fluoride efflux transporter CrcB [Endomicrobium sp.]|jgi:CrcB protein|nr:fluoride efflux transporter CrcB [Endomicrobium sp.]
MLVSAVCVFFGGAFGALSRFLISELFCITKWGIPFTLIFINFFGCLFMGIFGSLFELFDHSNSVKHFLLVGFLGGFTTLSSFSLEFFDLIKNSQIFLGFLYVFLSIVLSLSGFYFGYALIKVAIKCW